MRIGSINEVTLLGIVGKEPLVKDFSGRLNCQFSMATSEYYKDVDGKTQSKTTWHNITCWGVQAETAQALIHKGSTAFVKGKIQTREYTDKAGTKKVIYEILASHIYGGTLPKKDEVEMKQAIDDLPY